MNQTYSALTNHLKKYPLLKPRDAFKFLYHSVFGCEHMIASPEVVVNYIKEEFKNISPKEEIVEPLDGDFSRVNLDILNKGLSPETLGKLFFLSAKKEKGTIDELKEKISILKDIVNSGATPFLPEEFNKELSLWENEGYPAIHHSDDFRKSYAPAYRVISNSFIDYLPLLCEIDKKAENGNVIIAIEGSSASGKSTLGNLLKDIYDCNLFHTDDFFLQPHQRTRERLDSVGGNIDYERFYEEIALPLSLGNDINYQKFICSKFILEKQSTVPFKKITIVEGAYSMHPQFKEYYNISVFLDIPTPLQKERILKRNPDMADRFFNCWIPMEHKYFDAFNTKQKCDFVIPVK